MEKLLELRRKLKAKKPHFLRQDYNKQHCLAAVWRKPRGLQSKMRLSKRGKGVKVSPGYGSPVAVKGLDREGKQPVIVHTTGQLQAIDAKKQSIIVGSSIGDKKRVLILKEAVAKGITILNFKNPSEYISKVETKLNSKKKVKEIQSKETSAKKKDEKKELAEKITEEEQKEAEKKEKEKLLTKRER